METGLSSSLVCVTGASGGIGRSVAAAFAAEGTRLALFAHAQAAQLEHWVREQDWREDAMVLQADVRRPRELEEGFRRVVARWGKPRVCVVNAGIWPSEELPLWRLDEERVLHTIDVNLLGAMWTARAFLRALALEEPAETPSGSSLILIGSTAGRFGEAGHSDYAVSKAALYGLLRRRRSGTSPTPWPCGRSPGPTISPPRWSSWPRRGWHGTSAVRC